MKLPNSYGSVTKLSGHRRRPYWVRITTGYTDEGQAIRKTLGYFATRKEALACLTEWNAAPYDLANRALTFSEVYDRWVKWKYTDKGQEILHAYIYAYKHCKALYGLPFIDIRTRHIQGVIDGCPSGYSSKKDIKTICNQLFDYAIQQEIVSINYSKMAKLPARTLSRVHKPFTDAELSTLWENASDYGVRLVLIYCYTGFRPTELLKVKTKDVNIKERYMRGGSKTENGIDRVVPIADKILPFVEKLFDPDEEYLVIDPFDNKPMLTYDRLRGHVWERNAVIKPMQHLPHDCRHTCATLMDNASVPLKIQHLILGHRDADITRRVYTHKTISQLIEAIDSI